MIECSPSGAPQIHTSPSPVPVEGPIITVPGTLFDPPVAVADFVCLAPL